MPPRAPAVLTRRVGREGERSRGRGWDGAPSGILQELADFLSLRGELCCYLGRWPSELMSGAWLKDREA